MGPGWGQLTAKEYSLHELQEQDKGAGRAPPPTPTATPSLTRSTNIYEAETLEPDCLGSKPGCTADCPCDLHLSVPQFLHLTSGIPLTPCLVWSGHHIKSDCCHFFLLIIIIIVIIGLMLSQTF